MKTRSLILMAGLLLIVAAPSIAQGQGDSTTRLLANSQTFPDSTGEDAGAPDVTSVTVSNDDAGQITFQIKIANRPTLTPDMLFDIFVDADKNKATGAADVFGAEYAIELQAGSVDLFKWNGTTFAGGAPQTSLTYSYSATGATIKISARELGKTTGFNFALDAAAGVVADANGDPSFANAHDDVAPDPGHGTFSYQVLTKLSLRAVAFTASPSPAIAGASFSAGIAATQNDTNSAVKAGTVTCAATIGGTSLRAKSRRIVDGVAVCVWQLPKTAAGKTVRGTVTLTVKDARLSRPFAVKIASG